VTEADWDTCADPRAMLAVVRASSPLTDRKARLSAVACRLRTWPLLTQRLFGRRSGSQRTARGRGATPAADVAEMARTTRIDRAGGGAGVPVPRREPGGRCARLVSPAFAPWRWVPECLSTAPLVPLHGGRTIRQGGGAAAHKLLPACAPGQTGQFDKVSAYHVPME
jgi:hypothetical protein